jgi:hypothetical protein
MAAETGAKAAPEQPGNSFSLLLKAFLTGKRSFMPLSKAYLGC